MNTVLKWANLISLLFLTYFHQIHCKDQLRWSYGHQNVFSFLTSSQIPSVTKTSRSGGHISYHGGSRNLCSNYLEDRFRMWRTQKPPPSSLFGRGPAVWELSGECSHRLGPRARPATHTNPFRLLG